MELSNLDLLLSWDDVKAFSSRLKQKIVSIEYIYPKGGDIVSEGKASVAGDWSVCLEPKKSIDGKHLLFHVKAFELKAGAARIGFKAFKNFNPLNWNRSNEEYLVKKCAEKINGKFKGALPDKDCLQIDLASLLSAVLKTSIQIGRITWLRIEEGGIAHSYFRHINYCPLFKRLAVEHQPNRYGGRSGTPHLLGSAGKGDGTTA